MKNESLLIPILVGTKREGNHSSFVGEYVHRMAQKRDDLHTELFFADAILNSHESEKEPFLSYKKMIEKGDGLIIVSPEYNHGYPGSLKEILDLFLKEYIHKVVGVVGVSSGELGGARMIEHILPVLRELGLVCVSSDVRIGRVAEYFGESPSKNPDVFNVPVEKFLDELMWIGNTLKRGRKIQ